MSLAHGFAPIEPAVARILILGSLPSQASLAQGQYYAHPRNAFWHLMSAFTQVAAQQPYQERLSALLATGIGVWDLLKRAQRLGSLDANIKTHSQAYNNFEAWFERQPRTQAIFANGNTAYQGLKRHILPRLPEPFSNLPLIKLPSSSPAYAVKSVEQKMAEWHSAITPYLMPTSLAKKTPA